MSDSQDSRDLILFTRDKLVGGAAQCVSIPHSSCDQNICFTTSIFWRFRMFKLTRSADRSRVIPMADRSRRTFAPNLFSCEFSSDVLATRHDQTFAPEVLPVDEQRDEIRRRRPLAERLALRGGRFLPLARHAELLDAIPLQVIIDGCGAVVSQNRVSDLAGHGALQAAVLLKGRVSFAASVPVRASAAGAAFAAAPCVRQRRCSRAERRDDKPSAFHARHNAGRSRRRGPRE